MRARAPRKGERAAAPGPAPKPELYSLRSVVDHGFEDVPDEDEGASRRLTWTIEKRTVADKKTGRLMSAVYVLERDGVEIEFPNLGLARAAVHKTITHPERLTRPKAEYARAKK
jgi:CHASE2 domain-containing sensor protein